MIQKATFIHSDTDIQKRKNLKKMQQKHGKTEIEPGKKDYSHTLGINLLAQ
jgi:hypothetical protein